MEFVWLIIGLLALFMEDGVQAMIRHHDHHHPRHGNKYPESPSAGYNFQQEGEEEESHNFREDDAEHNFDEGDEAHNFEDSDEAHNFEDGDEAHNFEDGDEAHNQDEDHNFGLFHHHHKTQAERQLRQAERDRKHRYKHGGW